MTKKVLVALIIYLTTIILLTIYYGYNFDKYVHWKGNEFFYYVLFLLVTSSLFQIIISQTTKAMTITYGFIFTIVNCGLSFVLGFIFWTVSNISGIPRHLIFIYGGCFLTILSTVTILKALKYRAY